MVKRAATQTSEEWIPGEIGDIDESAGRTDIVPWLGALYLLLPLIIFAVSWLRLLPALVLLVAIGFGFWTMGRPVFRRWRWKPTLLISAGVAALWTFTSGLVGGLFAPAWDWSKHYAVFGDLVQKSWPVVYSMPHGGHDYLRYYLGFYLLPALGGKALGTAAIPWLASLWIAVGVALVLVQITRMFKSAWNQLAVAVTFALFSGMDLLGGEVVQWIYPLFRPFGIWTHLSDWSLPFELTSNMAQMHFIPNQALGGWLGMLLLLELLRRRNLAAVPIAILATLFWTPLATVGLAAFALVGGIVLLAKRVPWCNPKTLIPWAAMSAGIVLVGIYLTAGSRGIPKGFMWSRIPYIVFAQTWVILELVWVVIFLVSVLVVGVRPKWLYWVTAASLLVIPLYWFGYSDEFDRRASIPAILVMSLLVLRGVFGRDPLPVDTPRPRRVLARSGKVVLCLALIIGSATAVVEIRTRTTHGASDNAPVVNPACSLVLPRCQAIPKSELGQYLAPTSSLQLLLRQ